jgi:hypothetical protein
MELWLEKTLSGTLNKIERRFDHSERFLKAPQMRISLSEKTMKNCET